MPRKIPGSGLYFAVYKAIIRKSGYQESAQTPPGFSRAGGIASGPYGPTAPLPARRAYRPEGREQRAKGNCNEKRASPFANPTTLKASPFAEASEDRSFPRLRFPRVPSGHSALRLCFPRVPSGHSALRLRSLRLRSGHAGQAGQAGQVGGQVDEWQAEGKENGVH